MAGELVRIPNDDLVVPGPSEIVWWRRSYFSGHNASSKFDRAERKIDAVIVFASDRFFKIVGTECVRGTGDIRIQEA